MTSPSEIPPSPVSVRVAEVKRLDVAGADQVWAVWLGGDGHTQLMANAPADLAWALDTIRSLEAERDQYKSLNEVLNDVRGIASENEKLAARFNIDTCASLESERDAWKRYAEHRDACHECSPPFFCPEGQRLREATRT